jgi:hypothetical protein
MGELHYLYFPDVASGAQRKLNNMTQITQLIRDFLGLGRCDLVSVHFFLLVGIFPVLD